MIRHARGGGLPPEPVALLPVAMIQPAFLTALVPAIGATALAKARLPSAVLATVAMAAITMRADEEQAAAARFATEPQQENAFAVSLRRHCDMAVLDNGGLVVSG
jgi:hypothetical protein